MKNEEEVTFKFDCECGDHLVEIHAYDKIDDWVPEVFINFWQPKPRRTGKIASYFRGVWHGLMGNVWSAEELIVDPHTAEEMASALITAANTSRTPHIAPVDDPDDAV